MTTHVGRLRQDAAKILSKHGLQLNASDIFVAQGAWRTNKRLDVCCWQVFANGNQYICWQTLTQFVANAQKGGKVTLDNYEIFCSIKDCK